MNDEEIAGLIAVALIIVIFIAVFVI